MRTQLGTDTVNISTSSHLSLFVENVISLLVENVILRKRRPSQSEGLPTKDLCIPGRVPRCLRFLQGAGGSTVASSAQRSSDDGESMPVWEPRFYNFNL
jgi:hypothetical protein